MSLSFGQAEFFSPYMFIKADLSKAVFSQSQQKSSAFLVGWNV